MTNYKASTGHNVAEIDLDDLDPQPRSTGIQSTRRVGAASGTDYEDAEYVEMEYTALESAAAYQNVLADWGLSSALTANVTVYVRDATWAWVRKNGIAHRPQMGRDARWVDYFPRNITILVTDLETPT